MIYIYEPQMHSHVTVMKFPAGEVGVTLNTEIRSPHVEVKAHVQTSDDIMALLLTVDAIRRQHPSCRIDLLLPYIPYARQDRKCNEGEALSIAVFAKLLNSCDFGKVTVYDPHSDVAPALINNCVIVEQAEIFRDAIMYWGETTIVAPDAGALKKCNKFAQAVGAKGVLVCNKVRNLKTGRIESVTTSEEVKVGGKYFVLDDICDGGATFMQLSEVLKDAGRLDLGVTHGIFSKGVAQVADLYDNIYTTNSYHGDNFPVHSRVKWKEI